MHSTRAEPALYPLLCSVGKSAGIPQAAIDQMFWNMAPPPPGGRHQQSPQYSLAKVHEHLSVHAGTNANMLARIGHTLEQSAPSPVVAMFDMNWVNEKNGEPKACRLGDLVGPGQRCVFQGVLLRLSAFVSS